MDFFELFGDVPLNDDVRPVDWFRALLLLSSPKLKFFFNLTSFFFSACVFFSSTIQGGWFVVAVGVVAFNDISLILLFLELCLLNSLFVWLKLWLPVSSKWSLLWWFSFLSLFVRSLMLFRLLLLVRVCSSSLGTCIILGGLRLFGPFTRDAVKCVNLIELFFSCSSMKLFKSPLSGFSFSVDDSLGSLWNDDGFGVLNNLDFLRGKLGATLVEFVVDAVLVDLSSEFDCCFWRNSGPFCVDSLRLLFDFEIISLNLLVIALLNLVSGAGFLIGSLGGLSSAVVPLFRPLLLVKLFVLLEFLNILFVVWLDSGVGLIICTKLSGKTPILPFNSPVFVKQFH